MTLLSTPALAALREWHDLTVRYHRAIAAHDEHTASCALDQLRVAAQQACRLVWECVAGDVRPRQKEMPL